MAAYDVVLDGGKPWGIRLTGGKELRVPLKVGSVTPGSKASQLAIAGGEEIVSINGKDTTNATQEEATDLIKGTGDRLQLRLRKSQQQSQADTDFYADLAADFAGGGASKKAQSGTFQMLQEHVDSGNAGRMLSAFDKPTAANARNESIEASAATRLRNLNREGEYEALMEGGSPWGLRLQGGKGSEMPLTVASVTPRGKAERKGLVAGDRVITINDADASTLTVAEAQDIIKSTGEQLFMFLQGDTTFHQKNVYEEERDEMLYEMIKQDAVGKAPPQIKSHALRNLKKEVEAGKVDRVNAPAGPEATTVKLNQPIGGHTYGR